MNVAEELIEFEDRIDRAHVLRRLADWSSRIDDLYNNVLSWLDDGWTSAIVRTVPMDEPLMQRFDVAAAHLPVLRLASADRPDAVFEPRGLWIIGINGRIDLTRSVDHYIITDQSENFAAPDWQIASILNRRQWNPFNQARLNEILE